MIKGIKKFVILSHLILFYLADAKHWPIGEQFSPNNVNRKRNDFARSSPEEKHQHIITVILKLLYKIIKSS
jgi:hypothetical protein